MVFLFQTFIIDGKRNEIEVLFEEFFSISIDITTYSDSWRQYIPSGQQFLKIIGNNENNRINETFLIIEKTNNETKLRPQISI